MEWDGGLGSHLIVHSVLVIMVIKSLFECVIYAKRKVRDGSYEDNFGEYLASL
jgi:hypothetical protein